MLINGKFFLHDIHSVTLLQRLLQLHGVGNACGCAPWVHSVLILPNFGPMASQKFPSKNAVRLDQVDEVDSHGVIQPCALSIGPLEVHQDVISWRNLYTKIKSTKCRKCFAQYCIAMNMEFMELSSHLWRRHLVARVAVNQESDSVIIQWQRLPSREQDLDQWNVVRLPMANSKQGLKRIFKVSKLSFQTEPQQGVHVPCIIHSTFQPRVRASDTQKSQTNFFKCMQVYKSVLKCVELWSVFSPLSTNAPSIIKQHVDPHLCSWCPQSKPSSKMQNRNDAMRQ